MLVLSVHGSVRVCALGAGAGTNTDGHYSQRERARTPRVCALKTLCNVRTGGGHITGGG
jgi:hypothetical protein